MGASHIGVDHALGHGVEGGAIRLLAPAARAFFGDDGHGLGGLFAAHSLLVWVLLNNIMESTIFYAPVYSLGVVLVLAIVCTDRWWAARQPTSTSVPRVN
jgi:hypothetical protein